MATATVASALPPLMQARESEKDNKFPCDMKQDGQKCLRKFKYAQALGKHKQAVHGIAGTSSGAVRAKAKRTTPKKARNGQRIKLAARKVASTAPKVSELIHSGPASGKTSKVIEMTAANHPQIGSTLRVTGLVEGGDQQILMLLTQGDKEWKAVLS